MEKISKRDKVNWQDCKKFKHFDNPLKTYEDIPGDTKNCLKNTEKCEKLRKNVSNSEAVAKHSFYPLIAFPMNARCLLEWTNISRKEKGYLFPVFF